MLSAAVLVSLACVADSSLTLVEAAESLVLAIDSLVLAIDSLVGLAIDSLLLSDVEALLETAESVLPLVELLSAPDPAVKLCVSPRVSALAAVVSVGGNTKEAVVAPPPIKAEAASTPFNKEVFLLSRSVSTLISSG